MNLIEMLLYIYNGKTYRLILSICSFVFTITYLFYLIWRIYKFYERV